MSFFSQKSEECLKGEAGNRHTPEDVFACMNAHDAMVYMALNFIWMTTATRHKSGGKKALHNGKIDAISTGLSRKCHRFFSATCVDDGICG